MTVKTTIVGKITFSGESRCAHVSVQRTKRGTYENPVEVTLLLMNGRTETFEITRKAAHELKEVLNVAFLGGS